MAAYPRYGCQADALVAKNLKHWFHRLGCRRASHTCLASMANDTHARPITAIRRGRRSTRHYRLLGNQFHLDAHGNLRTRSDQTQRPSSTSHQTGTAEGNSPRPASIAQRTRPLNHPRRATPVNRHYARPYPRRPPRLSRHGDELEVASRWEKWKDIFLEEDLKLSR